MVYSDSFPHLLNEHFSEFNAVSSIRISYSISSTDLSGGATTALKLTGVNGFKSVTTFTGYLNHLHVSLIGKLMEVQPRLDEQGMRLFLKQSMIRCRKLTQVTIPIPVEIKPGDPDGDGHQKLQTVFYHPIFEHDPGDEPAEEIKKALLLITHRYAQMFKIVVDELLDELRCFFFLVEFFTVLNIPASLNHHSEKIPLADNVRILAGVMRLYYESGIFTITNKSEFCRLIASKFSTPHQKDISPGSLKNHFNDPTPETLQLIRDRLGKLMNNSRNLEKYY